MSITDTAHETAQGAGQNGRDLMNKAAKTARKLTDAVSERFGVANTEELAQKINTQSRRAYGQMKTQVRQRPAVAVGIAAGAGLILGLLLSNRTTH